MLVSFPVNVFAEQQKINNVRIVESADLTQDYLVISNESAEAEEKEDTGVFAPDYRKSAMNINQKPGVYQMDLNKPFVVKPTMKKSVKKASIKSSNQVGSIRPFWVKDLETDMDYSINAKLEYSGSKTNVWVNNNEITKQDAEKLGREFDQQIHGLITTNFGPESDVDGNRKVDILLYDIQDGFDGTGGFFAGYFYGRDLYNVSNSNQSEIFYIDSYPLMGIGAAKDVSQAYTTLAHEFQHMVNFNQNFLKENDGEGMDTWLDEALSMAAEQIYTGEALTDRIDYYNESESIANGHSLLKWEYNGDTLSNYALSYLFGQYLKVQANQGNSIFKEISRDSNNDYQAVENVVQKYIDPTMEFGQFMTSFRGALLLKQADGIYGFKGDPSFDGLEPRLFSFGSSAQLYGGGSIVKPVDSTPEEAYDKGPNITYTLFTADSSKVDQPTIPLDLSVDTVSDRDTIVTGQTAPDTEVYIQRGDSIIGLGRADADGYFSIPILKQKGGAELTVFAEDDDGNTSEAVTVTVLDQTPPPKPKINPVDDNDTVISGKAEPGSYVWVQIEDDWANDGTLVNASGNFSVKIKPQKAGAFIAVCAVDQYENQSDFSETFVIDKTPPKSLIVNALNAKSKTVTGKTEPKAFVEVKMGTKLLGKSQADAKGNYRVAIKPQKKGTKLTISVSDAAKNRKVVTATVR